MTLQNGIVLSTISLVCWLASSSAWAQGPSLTLVKTGVFNDESGDGIAQVGETISYSFTVSNTGTVNLTTIAITDPSVAPITCPSGNPIPSLAMGASVACVGTYTVLAADVTAGQKVNTATASSNEAGPEMDTATVVLPQPASMTHTKTGVFNDESGDGFAQVGETISYSFTVSNTGTVPLTNVAITDPSVAPITCPSGNPIPMLGVGAGETCVGNYLITPADVAAGQKVNTATASSNETPPITSSTTVPLPSASTISVGKAPASQTIPSGGTATFLVSAMSSGPSPLTNVTITDPVCSSLTGPTGDDGNNILEVGETWVWTCTVLNVTANFTNTATVTGTPGAGPPVTATGSATVIISAPVPALPVWAAVLLAVALLFLGMGLLRSRTLE